MQQQGSTANRLDEALTDGDLRWLRSVDLVTEAEYCARELAELRANGETDGRYWDYLTYRSARISGELKRRRQLAKYGGPSVPARAWIPPETIKEIAALTDLLALAGNYVKLTGAGNRVRFRCPVHGDGDDRDPSGVLYLGQQRWWCYGCNSGGDCFDWLMAFEAITFQQSVARLAELAGIELPLPSSRRKTKERGQPHVKVTFRH